MKVCRSLQCFCPRRIVSVGARHAGTRKSISLDAQALAIEEKFHRIAVGKAAHRNIVSLPSRPIPVRKDMEYGFAGPSTLIEVVSIFGKSACIQGAARAEL